MPTKPELGKQLYRKYCGQCHALQAALAAGFGSDKGLGQDGGPSFNNLKVPFNLSIVAVTEQFGGHELVVKRMTWTQLNQVSLLRRLRDEGQPVPRADLRRLARASLRARAAIFLRTYGQDPAVLDVLPLARGVEAHDRLERLVAGSHGRGRARRRPRAPRSRTPPRR